MFEEIQKEILKIGKVLRKGKRKAFDCDLIELNIDIFQMERIKIERQNLKKMIAGI
jgi:hypothetical protein